MDIELELFVSAHSSADVEEIKSILYKNHDNFIVKGLLEGQWQGKPEEFLWVVVVDYEDIIRDTASELKSVCKLPYLPVICDGDVLDW